MTRRLNCSPLHKIDLPDFERFEVITPNKHAARYLKVTENSLETIALKTITKANLRVASNITSHQLLREASRQIFDLNEADRAARSMKASVQTLLRMNIDLQKLFSNKSSKIQNLAQVTHLYVEILRAKGLIDSAQILWKAAELHPQSRRTFIYGFYRPRIDELNFIDAISTDGSFVFIPCTTDSIFRENQDAVQFLTQKGWELEKNLFEEELLNENLTVGERTALGFISGNPIENTLGINLSAYPNLESEVRGVLAVIKNKLRNGVPASEIGIVARDDSIYGPTVSAIAWEYQIPLRVLYDVPLSNTRLGAWIDLLLETIFDKLPFEATTRLLAQFLGPGFDTKQWTAVRTQHPSGLRRWQNLGIDLAMLIDLPKSDTRENWFSYFEEILQGFEISQKVSFWSREILAFYTFISELESLSEPADEVIPLEEFIAEVRQMLKITTVPSQPGRGGIELHTPLTISGARHQHLYVLGMAEGLFPPPANEDLILDFHERKNLNQEGYKLETAAIAARREALSFYSLLLTGTESVTLTYPQHLNERETLPSPFLSRLLEDYEIQIQFTDLPSFISSPEELRKSHLLENINTQTTDSVMEQALRAYLIEEHRESNEVCGEYDGNIELPFDFKNHVWSFSQLNKLGQCAFGWFGKYIVGLSEVREADDTLSPDVKGSFYHSVLELAARSVIGFKEQNYSSEQTRQLILDELEVAFINSEKDLDMDRFKGWQAQREEHLRILRRAVASDDFIKNGATILGSELKFSGEWEDFQVKGSLDRVDKGPDGLIIIDYKSGSSLSSGTKNKDGKTKLDIQLPLYSEIVTNSNLFPDDNRVAEAYYYSLSKGKVLKKSEVLNSVEKLDLVTRLKKILNDGSFIIEPDLERNACTYCELDLVCRKSSRLERKGKNDNG